MNQVILTGVLEADSELRMINGTSGGMPMLSFDLSTREKNDKEPIIHNIVAFYNVDERLSQLLRKGCHLTIMGKLKSRSYIDRNGSLRRNCSIVAYAIYPTKEIFPHSGEGNDKIKESSEKDCNIQKTKNYESYNDLEY